MKSNTKLFSFKFSHRNRKEDMDMLKFIHRLIYFY